MAEEYENKQFADNIIRQRLRDGYLSATDMCKANRKMINDYCRLQETKEFLDELAVDTGYPVIQLIQIKKGGNKHQQGTWVHPRVAFHLAVWLSPRFLVKVSNWIEEWQKYSQENQAKYQHEINNLVPSKQSQKEKEIQLRHAELLCGQMEVETPVGRIDILTESRLIEIKNITNWKDGVGQLICYGHFYPDHEKWLYLFDCEDTPEEVRQRIVLVCSDVSVRCDFETC